MVQVTRHFYYNITQIQDIYRKQVVCRSWACILEHFSSNNSERKEIAVAVVNVQAGCPIPCFNQIRPSLPGATTPCSQCPYSFLIPLVRSEFHSDSFFFRTVTLWKSLFFLRECVHDLFKSGVNRYLHNMYFLLPLFPYIRIYNNLTQ